MIYECGIMVSSDLSIGLCAQARPQICVFMIKEEMSEECPPAGEELDKVKYPYLSLLMNIDRSRGRFSFRIRRTTISCGPFSSIVFSVALNCRIFGGLLVK
jgi:hypothetical protein